MITATASGVRCGNHGTERVNHPTIDDVRACFRAGQFSAYQNRCANEIFSPEPDLSAFDAPAEPTRVYKSEVPLDHDGMYRNPETGQIFKVYITVHGAHQRVAKELVLLSEEQWYVKTVRGKEVTVKAEFVYRGKAGLRGLTGDMRMTLEEGKKYGAIYGVCVRCAATLTREESIERAMGPVCAGKDKW